MGNVKLDDECKYKELCKEMYGYDENFKCKGTNNCKHYESYLNGECTAIEIEELEDESEN